MAAFLSGLAGSRAYIFRTTAPGPKPVDAAKKILLFDGASSVLIAGPWIFAKDRKLKNPNLPTEHKSFLLEEPLDVQLA